MTTDLIDINRNYLKDSISTLDIIDNCYPANDLIDILSDSKERDKRLISDFKHDELIIKKVNRIDIKNQKVKRNIRYLTVKGVERYLTEGKIFSYKNACDIFGFTLIDKQHIEWDLYISKCKNETGEFNVNMILKWLFDKRKSCRHLGKYATIEEIITFAEPYLPNNDKIKYVNKINN